MNFAKTFIPKITQAQNTKITYTKMNTVFIYILQPEIVLWILIMKSIIALCVVGSWWIMKHEKEWYTCDRCGKEIKVGLLCMKSITQNGILNITYDLCNKCMEDFEVFMENE